MALECKNWYAYFKGNMETFGVPAPNGLFTTAASALATVTAISSQIERYGGYMTVSMIAAPGALGLISEQAGMAGAMLASVYVGIVLGSIMSANGSCIVDNLPSKRELLDFAQKHGINKPWLISAVTRYPQLTGSGDRKSLRHFATAPHALA